VGLAEARIAQGVRDPTMTETPGFYWPNPFRAIAVVGPVWDESSLRILAEPIFRQGAVEVELRNWPNEGDVTVWHAASSTPPPPR